MRFFHQGKNTKWHRWFAWYPVSVRDPESTIKIADSPMKNAFQYIWLEKVWRKKIYTHSIDGLHKKWTYSINDKEVAEEKVMKSDETANSGSAKASAFSTLYGKIRR